ncbi:hypothetical protein ACFO0N_04510 [Halobium salinum]|uniref:Uncharacterized protein n=1 Tax=Halobium salinum TaxID=1364940 RepID=A0ABD5P8N4_9EURY|nr:hypothetical protein [Halobium salinum]
MSLLDSVRTLLGGASADDGRRTVDRGGASGPSPTDFPPDDPLREFGDRWEPVEGGMDNFVVFPPAESPTDSIRRCSTVDETRRRLEFWYGEDATGEPGTKTP